LGNLKGGSGVFHVEGLAGLEDPAIFGSFPRTMTWKAWAMGDRGFDSAG